MSTEEAPAAPGSAAEEAAKLLGLVGAWVEEHMATGSPDCQMCPVCQGIAALRESKPEVVAHLAAAGVSLAAAVRELIDAGGSGSGGSAGTGGVEHIDIA